MALALAAGREVAGGMAAVEVGVAVEADSMAEGAEAFAVVMVGVASAVVTEVIEVVTVDGDMDAVMATGAVGDMGVVSG